MNAPPPNPAPVPAPAPVAQALDPLARVRCARCGKWGLHANGPRCLTCGAHLPPPGATPAATPRRETAPAPGWPPAQADSDRGGQPQTPYPHGAYQRGPSSQGMYPPGPNSRAMYPREPSQPPQYQPGGYVPGGYPPGTYANNPYSPYANHPYGPPMGYGYGTPAPRRSGRWLLPLVLGVLAVLVVGGGVYAASHLKTKAEAGAVPAGFTLYSDDAAHARIALPQDWTTEGTINGSKGLLATGPDGVGAIIVKSVNIAGDRVGGANGFITGAAGSGAVSNKTGPTDVTMAGETWTQEAADITRSGVTLHVVVLVAVHAEQTYILSYLATPRSLDDSNSKYFQPAIQSFAFTA